MYCVGQQSMEYKLFTKYYSKLIDTLPASDLSHYFVSDKIVSLKDHEKIIRSTTPEDATKLLLDRVSLELQNGNVTVLRKMLLIMDYHGVSAAKEISLEISTELSAFETRQGNCRQESYIKKVSKCKNNSQFSSYLNSYLVLLQNCPL